MLYQFFQLSLTFHLRNTARVDQWSYVGLPSCPLCRIWHGICFFAVCVVHYQRGSYEIKALAVYIRGKDLRLLVGIAYIGHVGFNVECGGVFGSFGLYAAGWIQLYIGFG